MGHGEQQRRSQRGDVVGGVAIRRQIFQVVVNLVRDAELLGILRDDVAHIFVRPGVQRTSRRATSNAGAVFCRKISSTSSGVSGLGFRAQQQLCALAERQRAMPDRRHAQHLHLVQRVGGALGDQPVAFAEQVVADVQRDGHAVGFVQGGRAVARGVAVFDVVVDQRGLVEALDGDGDFSQVGRERRSAFAVAQGLVRADGEERPPALAACGAIGGRCRRSRRATGP